MKTEKDEILIACLEIAYEKTSAIIESRNLSLVQNRTERIGFFVNFLKQEIKKYITYVEQETFYQHLISYMIDTTTWKDVGVKGKHLPNIHESKINQLLKFANFKSNSIETTIEKVNKEINLVNPLLDDIIQLNSVIGKILIELTTEMEKINVNSI